MNLMKILIHDFELLCLESGNTICQGKKKKNKFAPEKIRVIKVTGVISGTLACLGNVQCPTLILRILLGRQATGITRL